MSQKITIACDSACDLGPELARRYQIKVMPLFINLGDTSYSDGVNIHPEDIYRHYEQTGELPRTSAVSLADLQAFFEECTSEGNPLVFFTVGSTLSSTYGSACLIAKEFGNVSVVDTRNLSLGGGLLAITAAEMAAGGATASEIIEYCTRLTEYVSTSFIVDSLEFLHKGGRCSAVEAFGANLLSIKPSIDVRDGTLFVGKKYRGKFPSVVKKYLSDQLGDASAIDLERIVIAHAGWDEELFEQCVAQIKEIAPFKDVIATRAGCAISSHCGKNTVGLYFVRKNLSE